MTADELYELIHDDIAAALAEPDHSLRMTALRAAGDAAFRMAYDDVPGDPRGVDQASIDFLNVLNQAMVHTQPDGTDEQVDRIARVWSVAAANGAHYYSAPRSAKTWVTQQDDRVRDQHVPMHGITVGAGETFTVGGINMRYPGEPVGPPELWIGCRCSLNTSMAASADDDVLVAREFDAGKRKAMADKGTAMPDGSYPIANVEDLKNAIQAIGRAKNPDAVKRHIRKRAKALGHPELIPDSWTAAAESSGWNPDDHPDPQEEAGSLPGAGESATNVVESPQQMLARGTSPPGTHDAPGWITNPRETQRLRTYWTKGKGAAKIRWGQPGDFDRCRKQLGKYVQNPEHLAGTCANLHFVALGFWPGQGPHASGEPDFAEINAGITAAFTAAAELEDKPMTPTLLRPLEWFEDPGFDAPTPLTITADGRVLGHLASWDTCHVGITDECVKPPRSTHNYAYFRMGSVETAEGVMVPVGQITMDTGHAGKELSATATVRHYDDTGTGVADVAAGEDEHGIWLAGAMRPTVSEQQMYVLKATGTLSGDWRRIGGNLELVAALAVNVPGFPIPRPELAASAVDETVVALTAAAIVERDPNAVDVEAIAAAVVARLDERERRAANIARVSTLRSLVNGPRVAELVASVEAGA